MPRPALHDTRREAPRCSFWPFRVTENRVLAALGDACLPAASYAGGVVGGLSAVVHFVKGRGKGIIMREQKLTRRTFLGLGATAAVAGAAGLAGCAPAAKSDAGADAGAKVV